MYMKNIAAFIFILIGGIFGLGFIAVVGFVFYIYYQMHNIPGDPIAIAKNGNAEECIRHSGKILSDCHGQQCKVNGMLFGATCIALVSDTSVKICTEQQITPTALSDRYCTARETKEFCAHLVTAMTSSYCESLSN